MLTLSYGYKKPQAGDRGSVYFPALEEDIQRLNDHTHDGINSALLTGKAIVALSGAISAAGWVAVAGQPGTYSQLVAMPTGTLYAGYTPSFRINGGPSDGRVLSLRCNKTAAAQYEVFINDNTLDLTVLYLV